MAATYDLITTQTLSATSGTITVSNISQSYTDLVVTLFTKRPDGGTANDDGFIFNNQSTTSYSRIWQNSSGSGQDGISDKGIIYTSTNWYTSRIFIQGYSEQGNTYKPVMLNNYVGGYSHIAYTYSGSTTSVARIDFNSTSGQYFASGTVISLYGIARGTA